MVKGVVAKGNRTGNTLLMAIGMGNKEWMGRVKENRERQV